VEPLRLYKSFRNILVEDVKTAKAVLAYRFGMAWRRVPGDNDFF
jgi:hypothetical protein